MTMGSHFGLISNPQVIHQMTVAYQQKVYEYDKITASAHNNNCRKQ